ncbi:MarR family winged helix-turn-helix transcriptional regulator [Cellulomonas sp. NPDC058312]|uniref:MarR family winged helix-turn-helix transcriptional regulator n=1 Tax=Cellulomonas sp. NPDC058312 TaxID=3346441 RepID=UPI0036F0B802
MATSGSGVRLARLLIEGFEALVQEVVAELDRRGHPGVSAHLEFALSAITEGADNASDLGRALGVSRQAAAKSVATLEQLGYVDRVADPADARLKRLRVTPRGVEMMAIGAATFDELRTRWVRSLEPGRAELVEDALARLTPRAG